MSFGAPAERLTDERTVLAVGFAQAAFNDPHSIHPGVWTELKQHFTDAELMELCYLIGHYSGMQLVTALLQPDIERQE